MTRGVGCLRVLVALRLQGSSSPTYPSFLYSDLMVPQFCGIKFSGNYYLQSDSPCAPGNHPDGYDCGLIGALPVNCGKVDVEKKSWGTIKSLYKKDG